MHFASLKCEKETIYWICNKSAAASMLFCSFATLPLSCHHYVAIKELMQQSTTDADKPYLYEIPSILFMMSVIVHCTKNAQLIDLSDICGSHLSSVDTRWEFYYSLIPNWPLPFPPSILLLSSAGWQQMQVWGCKCKCEEGPLDLIWSRGRLAFDTCVRQERPLYRVPPSIIVKQCHFVYGT